MDTRTPAEIAYDATRLSPAPISADRAREIGREADRWAAALDLMRQHPDAVTLISARSGANYTTYAPRSGSTVELDVQNGAEPSIFFATDDGLDMPLTTLVRALPDLVALLNHPAVKALVRCHQLELDDPWVAISKALLS